MNEYKNKMIDRFSNYKYAIHTNSDNEYSYLKDGYFCFEIVNEGYDSLYIFFEDEITVSYGLWHCHYSFDDLDDFNLVIEKVNNILQNKDCILIIYSNNNCFGCGSLFDKNNFSNADIIDFINSFFGEQYPLGFKKYGAKVCFKYWDYNKDYELFLDKDYFNS